MVLAAREPRPQIRYTRESQGTQVTVSQPPITQSPPGHFLPATPRPVTPHVSRRIWLDPRVRFWWLTGVVLIVLMLYFAVARIYDWKQDSDLVLHGTPVTATVGVEGVPRAGYVPPSGTPYTLSFTLNGQDQQVTGTLEGHTEVPTGQKLAIRIDPNDLTRWTDLTEPRGLGGYLIVPVLIAPIVLAALVAAAWIRRGLLLVWRNGIGESAVVVDRRQTALAPMSQALRCTIPSRSDKRLVLIYLPGQSPKLQRGETVTIVRDTQKGATAIASAWVT